MAITFFFFFFWTNLCIVNNYFEVGFLGQRVKTDNVAYSKRCI